MISRLIAYGPLNALVGSKIHWVKIPQDTTGNYVRLQTISDPRDSHLQGFQGSRVTRVQVDCFSPSFTTSRAIAEAIIGAMSLPATVDGITFGRTNVDIVRDLGEDTPTGYVHRTSVDLLVEHKAA
jgi:hypothetical protein